MSEPEKCHFSSDPAELTCLCSMAVELRAHMLCPTSALLHSCQFLGTNEETLFPDDYAQTGLMLVNFKGGKLRRARCRVKFSNFWKRTGLLESPNCCYLKNIKISLTVAHAKKSFTPLV